MSNRFELTVTEVLEQMKAENPPRLLDVRELTEWDKVHLQDATLVTQELVDEIIGQWPKDTPIVCYCHHGMRSLNATAFLSGQGFSNVRSMAGGIDAWAREVDPSLSRY